MSAADLIPVVAPQFMGHAGLSAALDIADSQVAVGHCYRDQVIANLAAHILTMGQRSGQAGALTGETIDGVAYTFSVAASEGLGVTSYGQEVQRLNRLCYGMTARTGWS